jgi:choline dehydrogenase-like flavoprotein
MAAWTGLSERERAILGALCDGFHPSLTAEAGDDDVLFGLSASELGVPAAAEQAIGLLPAAERSQLRQLIALLDVGLITRMLAGVPGGVRNMSDDERGRLLTSLATSRVPQLRSGFQALKRLSSFLFYSVTDESGDSRVWSRIGYQPSPQPSTQAPRLAVKEITAETKLDADACVIGSGAGGGVAAASLAMRGLKVVVLEAGPPDQAGDFSQRELDATQRLMLGSGLTSTRDLGIALLGGACLGGGTAINWQTTLRTPDAVRDEWSSASRSNLFTSPQYTQALDAVMARVGASTKESPVNANNATIERGCHALGYAWSQLPRNSVGCDTDQCGYCVFGCRIGGKQSTTVTYLRDAQMHGDTTIVANCRADMVTVAGGRAIGVIATATRADGTKVRVTVRAPRVVVAAGGIHSPALLLRSGLSLPQIGRNLYIHPTTATVGMYRDRVEAWHGPPQTIICSEFTAVDGQLGFRLEAAPAHPGLLGFALPWTSARDHRRLVQRCAHGSAIIVLSRDSNSGSVRVRRDGSAIIDYAPDKRSQAILARGMAEAGRVHFAAGADEVITFHVKPVTLARTASTTAHDIDAFHERVVAARVGANWSGVFSAHQMGTCRIGDHPRSAVCNERGEVFGVRGLYVADASTFPLPSGVNPMITVMAVAKCVADGIE